MIQYIFSNTTNKAWAAVAIEGECLSSIGFGTVVAAWEQGLLFMAAARLISQHNV